MLKAQKILQYLKDKGKIKNLILVYLLETYFWEVSMHQVKSLQHTMPLRHTKVDLKNFHPFKRNKFPDPLPKSSSFFSKT